MYFILQLLFQLHETSMPGVYGTASLTHSFSPTERSQADAEGIYDDPFEVAHMKREPTYESFAGASMPRSQTGSSLRRPDAHLSLADAIHPGQQARVGVSVITSHIHERYIVETSLPRHVHDEILRFFQSGDVDEVTWERIVDDVGVRDALPVNAGKLQERAKHLLQVFPMVSRDWKQLMAAFERNRCERPALSIKAWLESSELRRRLRRRP